MKRNNPIPNTMSTLSAIIIRKIPKTNMKNVTTPRTDFTVILRESIPKSGFDPTFLPHNLGHLKNIQPGIEIIDLLEGF